MTEQVVLDCSVAMAWCFEDETSAFTEAVLDAVVAGGAVAPGLWPLEVVNVLLVSERKKRLTPEQAALFLNRLLSLPIEIEGAVAADTWPRVQTLGRAHGLTAYDAAYLDVAARRGLPLATCDRALRSAAQAAGVALYAAGASSGGRR